MKICLLVILLTLSPSRSFIPQTPFWRVSQSSKDRCESSSSSKRLVNTRVESSGLKKNEVFTKEPENTGHKESKAKYIHPEVFKMYQRAQSLIKNGDKLEARKLLYECIELNQYDSHSWLSLARLEAQIGNVDKARDLFKRSLELCPANVHILHARGLLEQKYGNVEMARDCWSKAFAIDPMNAYVCHAFSNLEKRLRNYKRAKEILQDVVKRKPTATICISLAELERQLGSAEMAKEVLENGLKRCDKERSKLLLSLAWLEEDAFGKVERAAELIEEAMQIDRYNVRVHIAKASLQLRQNKVQLARETLKHATGLPAEDGQHYTMWSTIEAESGNYDMARKILEKGSRQYPGDQFLLQRWGTIEAKHGSVQKARELFQRSVTIQPHAPTYVAWAILEENEGNEALLSDILPHAPTHTTSTAPLGDMNTLKSASTVDLEFEQDPGHKEHDISEVTLRESGGDPSSRIVMAKQEGGMEGGGMEGQNWPSTTTVREGEKKKSAKGVGKAFARQKLEVARGLFATGMDSDPQHGPLYHAYGNMELRRGNITGARDIFKRGIQTNCTDLTSLYHAWGLLEIKDSNRATAEEIFRLGIKMGLKGTKELDHGVDFLLHSLGMLELYSRKFGEAKEVFLKGIELFPKHSHMLLGLALTSMKLGDHAGAREYFRAAVDADALHLHAWQSWAIAEKQLGNIELAGLLFRQGLVHGPMHGALWQGYAVMEMQQGKFEIARTLFEESIRRSPAHAQSYQAWACLEARLGNLDIAKALAWRGIRRAPAHAALWTVAGVVEDRLGNVQRAKEIFLEGIQRFPDHGALYKVLGELHIRQGEHNRARELFAQALDQDPLYAPVYHAAALLEAKLGNLDRLSSLHQKAKAYFHSDPDSDSSDPNSKRQINVSLLDMTLGPDRKTLLLDMESDPETRQSEMDDIIERIKVLEMSAKEGGQGAGAGKETGTDTALLGIESFSSEGGAFLFNFEQQPS